MKYLEAKDTTALDASRSMVDNETIPVFVLWPCCNSLAQKREIMVQKMAGSENISIRISSSSRPCRFLIFPKSPLLPAQRAKCKVRLSTEASRVPMQGVDRRRCIIIGHDVYQTLSVHTRTALCARSLVWWIYGVRGSTRYSRIDCLICT